MTNYKITKTFDERANESKEITDKYPNRIPLIVEKLDNKNDNIIPKIDKNKYLVPDDLTVGQLVYVVRKRIKITPEKAIFIFCDNKLLNSGLTMREVYENHKDKDGFVYIIYSGESTFG
jgi:GABA(A) receptor-associated protein